MVRSTRIKRKQRQRKMYVINKPAEFLIPCECVSSTLENLIYLPSIIKLHYGVIHGKYSCKSNIFSFSQSMHTKNCFENHSQLNHNSHQSIPERKLNAVAYRQLQSSNSPAGGAVAREVSEVQHLKEQGGYLELHGKDPRQINNWKFITPWGFAKWQDSELQNNL